MSLIIITALSGLFAGAALLTQYGHSESRGRRYTVGLSAVSVTLIVPAIAYLLLNSFTYYPVVKTTLEQPDSFERDMACLMASFIILVTLAANLRKGAALALATLVVASLVFSVMGSFAGYLSLANETDQASASAHSH